MRKTRKVSVDRTIESGVDAVGLETYAEASR
jgi:hypothetical protein